MLFPWSSVFPAKPLQVRIAAQSRFNRTRQHSIWSSPIVTSYKGWYWLFKDAMRNKESIGKAFPSSPIQLLVIGFLGTPNLPYVFGSTFHASVFFFILLFPNLIAMSSTGSIHEVVNFSFFSNDFPESPPVLVF